MTSLLREYNKRNKTEYLSPIDEGILFVENEKNSYICLVSSPQRSRKNCPSCIHKNNFILEVFPGFFEDRIPLHVHMLIEENLLNYLPKGNIFYPTDQYEIESWLWNYFKKYSQYSKELKTKNQDMISEMIHYSEYKPNVLNYYIANYYTFYLLNKKYIAF